MICFWKSKHFPNILLSRKLRLRSSFHKSKNIFSSKAKTPIKIRTLTLFSFFYIKTFLASFPSSSFGSYGNFSVERKPESGSDLERLRLAFFFWKMLSYHKQISLLRDDLFPISGHSYCWVSIFMAFRPLSGFWHYEPESGMVDGFSSPSMKGTCSGIGMHWIMCHPILNCKTEVAGDKHFCHFSYERGIFCRGIQFSGE